MAFLMFPRLLAMAAIAIRLVAGGHTVGVCKDKVCGDCPEKLELRPEDEYPQCGHWNMTKIMQNQTGFPEWASGGYAPFLNIGQPEPGCQIVVRTSTSTDVPGCGVPVAAFHHAFCFQLPIQGLFMVQYCCGVGDCMQGPIPPEDRETHLNPKRSNKPKKESSKKCAPRKLFEKQPDKRPKGEREKRDAHPRIMIPKGDPDPARRWLYYENGRVTIPYRRPQLNITTFPRKVAWPAYGCPDWGSWRILRKYTKPSTVTTPVSMRLHGGPGGGGISIGVSRSDSWTFNFGASYSVPYNWTPSVNVGGSWSCSISDNEGTSLTIPPHASGHMGFTAIHLCEIGTYTCEGRQQEPQEICYPYKENRRIAGVYHLIKGG